MDLGIEGRVAVVAASSKGLGLASALALAAEGAKVVICGRSWQALEDAEARLAAVGTAHSIRLDVTEPDAGDRLVQTALDRFGRIDIVVPNAGGPPPGSALDVTDEQIHAAIDANLLSSVRLVRAAAPHLREQRWGRICAIASWSVKQPVPTLALSNTARTGLWAWAKTAAADLAPDGVTLNLACPGPHATDRMKQLAGGATSSIAMGDPADFGRVVAFLCSEPAGFVNGVALQVDGGDVAGLL